MYIFCSFEGGQGQQALARTTKGGRLRTSLRPWSTLAVMTFIFGKRPQTFFMPSGLAI